MSPEWWHETVCLLPSSHRQSYELTPQASNAPSRVVMQAEGIKSEPLWFSKKVSAFIAFSFNHILEVEKLKPTPTPPLCLPEAKHRLRGRQQTARWTTSRDGGSKCCSLYLLLLLLCHLWHGRGSDLWRQQNTHKPGALKLCRKWCCVELIKGWESQGDRDWMPVEWTGDLWALERFYTHSCRDKCESACISHAI